MSSHQSPPSRVLYFSELPRGTGYDDVVRACPSASQVTHIEFLPRGTEALVEVESVQVAQGILAFAQFNPLKINGVPVRVFFSTRQSLPRRDNPRNPGGPGPVPPPHHHQQQQHGPPSHVDHPRGGQEHPRGGQEGYAPRDAPREPPLRAAPSVLPPPQQQTHSSTGRCLLFVISLPFHPIDVNVISAIIKPLGELLRVVIFEKNGGVQALVEMRTAADAAAVLARLDGQQIYDGCCNLRITYARNESLTIKENSETSRDFTNPTLPFRRVTAPGGPGYVGSSAPSGGPSQQLAGPGASRSALPPLPAAGGGGGGGGYGSAAGAYGAPPGYGSGAPGPTHTGGLPNQQSGGGYDRDRRDAGGPGYGNAPAYNNGGGQGGGYAPPRDAPFYGAEPVAPPRYEGRGAPEPRYESRVPEPRYESRAPEPRYDSRAPEPRYESRAPEPRYESRVPEPRYEGGRGGGAPVAGGGYEDRGPVRGGPAQPYRDEQGGGGYVRGGPQAEYGSGGVSGGGQRVDYRDAPVGRAGGGVGGGGGGGGGEYNPSHGGYPRDGGQAYDDRRGRAGGPTGPASVGQSGGGAGLPPGCVLMVYNLPRAKVGCDQLFNLFCVYGNIVRIKALTKPENSAMVQFESPLCASHAIEALNRLPAFGITLSITTSRQLEINRPEEDGAPNQPPVPPGVIVKEYGESFLNRFKQSSGVPARAPYKPNNILYFGNVPAGTDEAGVKALLGGTGVKEPHTVIFLPPPKDGGHHGGRRSGFLEYDSVESALETLCVANNAKLLGSSVPLKLTFSGKSAVHMPGGGPGGGARKDGDAAAPAPHSSSSSSGTQEHHRARSRSRSGGRSAGVPPRKEEEETAAAVAGGDGVQEGVQEGTGQEGAPAVEAVGAPAPPETVTEEEVML